MQISKKLSAYVAFGAFSSLAAINAFANTELSLAKLSPDHDQAPSELKLLVDGDSKIVSLRYYVDSGEYTDTPIDQFASTPTILHRSGKDIFRIESKDMDAAKGGHLTFIYLQNGILNRYRNFDMQLAHTAKGWTLEDSTGANPINQLNLKMNLDIFKDVIGVDDIQGSLQTATDMALAQGSHIEKVLLVSSDAMDGTLDLEVSLDDDSNLKGLRYDTSKGHFLDIPLTDLANGTVIYKDSGYDIVKLKSENFDAKSGGKVIVIYTRNAFWGTHGELELNLVRNGNAWNFEVNDNSGRRKVTEMYMAKNSSWGKTWGIDNVTVK